MNFWFWVGHYTVTFPGLPHEWGEGLGTHLTWAWQKVAWRGEKGKY